MKPLETTKSVLIWLYMCPTEANLSRKKNIARYIFASIILIVDLSALPPQLALLLKSMKINLAEALFALMSVIAIIGTIYAMISAYRLRQKTIKIFTDLSAIYDESEGYFIQIQSILQFNFNFFWIIDNSGKLIDILRHANKKCEWLWTIQFKFMATFFLSVILLCGMSIILCWLNHGELQIEHLYHPADTMCAKFFLRLLFKKFIQNVHITDCFGIRALFWDILLKFLGAFYFLKDIIFKMVYFCCYLCLCAFTTKPSSKCFNIWRLNWIKMTHIDVYKSICAN